MGDFGLLKQGWKWIQYQKQAFAGTGVAASCTRDKLAFLVDRHWPMVSTGFVTLVRLTLVVLLYWRDCAVKGFWSLASLGTAALFVIMWSCFLSFTSASCLIYALLGLGAAGAAICVLGSTPGLFIVGSFGILVMWICGNFWLTGMLLIVGGYMFSLNHARPLILFSTAYALYFVHVRAGWVGVFLSLNLSFISNNLLNKVLQGYDGASEGTCFEEQKEPEPFVEDFLGDCEYSPPTSEAENVNPSKSSCTTLPTPNVLSIQKGAPSSKVLKVESTSIDEMKRIMNSSNHYEALGFPRQKSIDPLVLKKEYRRMAVLVHPDKNMGNPLASESFKKIQSAYEVLSDLTKKKTYDDQLRKEESRKIFQNSQGTSRQDGIDFHSEESRRIECTKCGNSHIWICTTKIKASARWCQDCSQYHPAKDGEGWVEYRCSRIFSSPKVEIPQAFVCAESKIFDVSEWAICQVTFQVHQLVHHPQHWRWWLKALLFLFWQCEVAGRLHYLLMTSSAVSHCCQPDLRPRLLIVGRKGHHCRNKQTDPHHSAHHARHKNDCPPLAVAFLLQLRCWESPLWDGRRVCCRHRSFVPAKECHHCRGDCCGVVVVRDQVQLRWSSG